MKTTEGQQKPTATELANLVARLARRSKRPATELVAEAYELWKKCHQTVAKEDQPPVDPDDEESEESEAQRAHRLKGVFAREFAKLKLKRPEKFPVTFDGFLLLVLPEFKGRTGERAGIYRKYLGVRESLSEPTTKEEVDQEFSKERGEPINEPEFTSKAVLFRRWYETWRKERISSARRAAGKARKRKARPPVEKLREALGAKSEIVKAES